MKTIQNLIDHVTSECTKVDREERFRQSLDSEGEVNVAGLTFMPSRIWEEMDPMAFRCGVNDYMDGQDVTEVDGDCYEDREIEKARESFVDELNDDLAGLQSELEDEEGEDEPDVSEVGRLTREIGELEKFIVECEKYAF